MTGKEFFDQLERLEYETEHGWMKQQVDVSFILHVEGSGVESWHCFIRERAEQHELGIGLSATPHEAMEGALKELTDCLVDWGFRYAT